MSFLEMYRVDLGFGGTSFGYENYKSIDGERFICHGNGFTDQLFIPNSKDRLVVSRSVNGEGIMDARYGMDGDLVEVGVLLEPYYKWYINMKGIRVEPEVQSELDQTTDFGNDAALCYVNLSRRVVGFVSGDSLDPDLNYIDESPFMIEREGDHEAV